MTTIASSTSFDPTNPIDYASSMAGIVNSMNQNTLNTVGSIIGGLPTVQDLTQGAYGFEQSVSQNSQAALNQTLFGTPQQSSGKNIATPQSQGVEGMLQGDFNQLIPSLTSLGQQAATNQAAAIQAQSAQAQAEAASAGGGGKK